MENKKIEIEQYIPNQELALKVTNHKEIAKNATFLYGLIALAGLLSIFAFKTMLPFLFLMTFLIFYIKGEPKPFLKRAVFDSKTLLLVYSTPLIDWTSVYHLDSGIDWFVDLKSKPIAVQIGTNGNILIDFELENEHDLPLLTDKIGALTRMDFEDNQMTDKYEVLRFRPHFQQKSNDDFYFMGVEKNKNSIRVKVGMSNPFWIDLKNEVLYYNNWFSEKSIPLRFIGHIYCEIPNHFNYGFVAEWYFYDTQKKENVLFFTLKTGEKRDTNIKMDMDYQVLNFRNDMTQLKSILEEIPALENIKIELVNR